MVIARRGARFVPFVAPVAVVVVLQCGGDGGTAPPTPRTISLVSGNGQSAPAGQPLANPVVVQVNDDQGRGVSGVAVDFTVSQGNGTVAAPSVTTGSNGQASTSWTVGTTAGSAQQVRAQVSSPALGPVTFTASVTAGPAAGIEGLSGDGQQSTQNSPLPQPLVVRVTDQYGNFVAGQAVTWTVLTGGGSVNPAANATQMNGEAQTVWTLGPVGPQTAQAGAAGLTVDFGATALNLALTSVTPDTLVEGQAATLIGEGFDATPSNNTVLVGGVAATVTAATTTTLDITVPTFDCQPARDVGVQVTVGGGSTPAITKRVHPAAFTEPAVGAQVIIQDPSAFCFQFRPSTTGNDAYLVGVGAAAEVPSSVMSFDLTATAGAPTAVANAAEAAEFVAPPPTVVARPVEQALLLARQRHARTERAIRGAEREVFQLHRAGAVRARRVAGAGRAPAAVPAVGDTLRVRVISTSTVCGAFTEIDAVVREVGQAGVWATDVELPATDSLTDSDIAAFSATFDASIYPVDTLYFGAPSDLDDNQRVTVVLTQRVNSLGFAGFVSPGDLFAQTDCAPSNEGEYFYGWVPDPNGSLGFSLPKSTVVNFMPLLVAHEFAHNIQVSRRLFDPNATTLQSVWESEGQASLAEEVVGHAALGNQPGQNYGSAVVNQGGGVFWYQQAFLSLAIYFGWTPPSGKVAGAPDVCTLFEYTPGPCGDDDFYGASFALNRLFTDRYASTYLGGEPQLHRDLIGANTTLAGRANVEAVLGADFDTLFAQWAAMLYIDGRVAGAQAEIQMASWNLLSIFNAYNSDLQLVVPQRTFAGFTDGRTVRGGSTAYTRIASTGPRGALAVRARTAAGGFLSPTFAPQLWIVRLQ